jgi:alkaline phosphatase D
MPVWPHLEADGSQRIYQQWQWGQLADVWMLDCRQYRSPQPCRDPFRGGGRIVLNCDEAQAPSQTMLGVQQEAWLYQGLQQSKKRWRIIGQNTQMSPTRVQTPMGTTLYSDGWEGYAAARQRLLQTVAQLDVRNVVVLGGDVHQNVAANLRVNGNDPASPIVASEFVGTSITSKGLGRTAAQRVKDSNPDIAYLRSDERGYALLHITPNQVQTTFRTTSHPVQANATLQVQARFGVNHGVAGIIKLDD